MKEANAVIRVEGILAENNLKETNENGKEVISGNMVIQTSDINFVTINVYSAKLTKDGKENKAYAGLKTVMKEYQSIAEVGREEASLVFVKGQMKPNLFVNDKLEVRDSIRFTSNFFNRVKDADCFKAKAEFDVELFIKSIVPEVVETGEAQGEETGRLLIKGYMPSYNNTLGLVQIVVPQDLSDAVSGLIEVGQTVTIYGDIVNSKIEKTIEVPVAIGKPRVETRTTYKNELVLTGVEEPCGEETAYKPEEIKQALAIREEQIAELIANKKSGKDKPATKKTGAAQKSGRALPF